MNLLTGKIALVTACTQGIGLASVKKLAEHGAKVYLAVNEPDEGMEIAEKIRASGGKADTVYFDAFKRETHEMMIQEVLNKEGCLDILVNTFGTTDVNADFDLIDGDSEIFFQIIENNLRSVYTPSKAAVKSMINTGGGSIINISSVGGRYPDISRTAYGIAKAAIDFLTKDIAIQYAKYQIRCNSIQPGFIATKSALDSMSPEFLDTFLKNVPLNRAGQPEDIANAVLFFASDQSSFVTGECMPVAGGFGLPSPMYSQYEHLKKKG